MPKHLVARWETRGKKYWYEVYSNGSFRGDNSGGWRSNLDEAIDFVVGMVDGARRIDKINMRPVTPVRRQRNALCADAREMWCSHSHAPYRGRGGMPCTGPRVCTMCGMLLDPDTRVPIAGQEGDLCVK